VFIWRSKINRDGKPYGKSHVLDSDGEPVCVGMIDRAPKWINRFQCAWGAEEPSAQRCGLCVRIVTRFDWRRARLAGER
jgi:hypothetical protein